MILLAEKKARFGSKNVHCALYDADTGLFEDLAPIIGAVALTPASRKTDYTFYADNEI
jgi:hypothetical protein